MRKARGFTLVEMLIVVAIILLLISMAMPWLYRAKHLGKLTVCAEHQHQFAVALHSYAQNYNGYLPRQDLRNTGQNLWDVAKDFYLILKNDYKLPHLMFFCPDTPPEVMESGNSRSWDKYGDFYMIGYLYWVQRTYGGTLRPPDYSNVSGMSNILIRGPRSLHDIQAMENPLLTCFVGTWGASTGVLNEDDPAINLDVRSVHRVKGKVDAINEAFYDGHVERFNHDKLRCVYSGNCYNWR